jgi:hypothetical protein
MSGSSGTQTHTIVLAEAGPTPQAVLAALRELGCPEDPAQAFVRAAAAGSRPTIMYDVPADEARRVVDTLRSRSATVTAIPDLAPVGGPPPGATWPPPGDPGPPAPQAPPLPAPSYGAPEAPPAGAPWPHPPIDAPAEPAAPPVALPTTPDAVVGRYVTAYNAGDAAAIRDLFAPDAVFDDSDGQVMAVGQDAIGGLFANLIEHIPGRHVSVAGRMCLGSWVVDHQVAHTPGQPDQPSLATYLVVDGLIHRVMLLRG